MDVGGYIAILTILFSVAAYWWLELLALAEKHKPALEQKQLWKKKSAPVTIREVLDSHEATHKVLIAYFTDLQFAEKLAINYALCLIIFVIFPAFFVHLFSDLLKSKPFASISNYLGVAQFVLLAVLIAIMVLLMRSLRYRKRLFQGCMHC